LRSLGGFVFGTTRSSIRRNHALIAPDSHVQSPLPGWNSAKGILLITPAMGARFTQYLALLDPGATSALAPASIQRFVFVLAGTLLVHSDDQAHTLQPGGYAYFPPDHDHALVAETPARILVFEKPYASLPDHAPPAALIGQEAALPAAPFLGDPDAQLKYLLPSSPAWDMEMNLFTFNPGACLPLVETHVMEHGLIFLQGGGIYRLDEHWYPVQQGDVIWMGPFCPQWFAAVGKTPARYLYYKDVNREPWGRA
jgi:(S)-ureidoglycine aminohydrolase